MGDEWAQGWTLFLRSLLPLRDKPAGCGRNGREAVLVWICNYDKTLTKNNLDEKRFIPAYTWNPSLREARARAEAEAREELC